MKPTLTAEEHGRLQELLQLAERLEERIGEVEREACVLLGVDPNALVGAEDRREQIFDAVWNRSEGAEWLERLGVRLG